VLNILQGSVAEHLRCGGILSDIEFCAEFCVERVFKTGQNLAKL